MPKMTKEAALKEVEAIMGKCVRFHETGYQGHHVGDPKKLMVVGMVVEGGFGVADKFFDALRILGKVKVQPGFWNFKRHNYYR